MSSVHYNDVDFSRIVIDKMREEPVKNNQSVINKVKYARYRKDDGKEGYFLVTLCPFECELGIVEAKENNGVGYECIYTSIDERNPEQIKCYQFLEKLKNHFTQDLINDEDADPFNKLVTLTPMRYLYFKPQKKNPKTKKMETIDGYENKWMVKLKLLNIKTKNGLWETSFIDLATEEKIEKIQKGIAFTFIPTIYIKKLNLGKDIVLVSELYSAHIHNCRKAERKTPEDNVSQKYKHLASSDTSYKQILTKLNKELPPKELPNPIDTQIMLSDEENESPKTKSPHKKITHENSDDSDHDTKKSENTPELPKKSQTQEQQQSKNINKLPMKTIMDDSDEEDYMPKRKINIDDVRQIKTKSSKIFPQHSKVK